MAKTEETTGPKSFEQALREQLDANKDMVSPYKRRRLMRLLNSTGPLRERRIRRLEAHAETHLRSEGVELVKPGSPDGAGIDWGAIDWDKFFTQLFELLMKLLPLILAL